MTLTSHNLNIPEDGVDVDVNGVRKVHASTCDVRFTTPLAETERANESLSLAVNEAQLTVFLLYTGFVFVQHICQRHN